MPSFEIEIDNKLDYESPLYSAFDVTVEYTVSEYIPERAYLSNGDPGYPSEGGEIEIISVQDAYGEIHEGLCDAWFSVLMDAAIKHASENEYI
jgi:hypothetical protein